MLLLVVTLDILLERQVQYWWVSQNQTHKQEISGGYMWSPKTDAKGNHIKAYENMTKVCVGDVIFSFFSSNIQMVGVAEGVAFSSGKPEEFGDAGKAWSNNGWTVPVAWTALPKKIAPKDHIEDLINFLPQMHSPIRKDGSGNQAYLFQISEHLAAQIFVLSGQDPNECKSLITPVNHTSQATTRFERAIQDRIESDQSLSVTEKAALVKARRGQGKFKSNLMKIETCCRVTGVSDPRLLIASHIKSWASCDSNFERLDGNNGLLLTPNVDKLFDSGFISFDDNGKLLISSKIEIDDLIKLGFSSGHKTNVGAFNKMQIFYLDFHRRYIFKS